MNDAALLIGANRPVDARGFRFGLAGDAEITSRSVAEICKPSLRVERGSVYDHRLGAPETGDAVCVTCERDRWQCPGHFGHIELAYPVLIFYKEAATWAKRCCHTCGALLTTLERSSAEKCTSDDSKLSSTRLTEKRTLTRQSPAPFSICSICGTQQPVVKLADPQDPGAVRIVARRKNGTKYVLEPPALACIFDRISDSDVITALRGGTDAIQFFHPRNLILTKLPVLPPCCRPKARQWPAGGAQDDNLSVFLTQIIKLNNKLRALPTPTPPERADEARQLIAALKLKTLCFADNSKGKAVHATNRKPMVGIKERLSKKTGILRQNMMGKRRDQTGRSVVGPDGTLRLNEVGVPLEIARNLTIPQYVTPFNVDLLQRLIETNGASTVTCGKTGQKTRLGIRLAAQPLEHGDTLIHSLTGQRRPVLDCREIVPAEWKIYARGDGVEKLHARPKLVLPPRLKPGDVVERYLQNGDPVVVNRQPTLHRNSMLGMKVILRAGKTIRLNLAVTGGFNMDFDGDEGNLYLPQSEEARAEVALLMDPRRVMLSTRSESAEITPVQDGILGAYLMTRSDAKPLSRDDYFHCLEVIVDLVPDPIVDDTRFPRAPARLIDALLPADFNFKGPLGDEPPFRICNGRCQGGPLTKTAVKKLVRVLCLERGVDAAVLFVDGIQYVTNAWLTLNPFTAGYDDCLTLRPVETQTNIRAAVFRKFAEAEREARTAHGPAERERAVSLALGGARDAGQILARKALAVNNRMAVMAAAGSKGDYFNLTQISGLLGQQYVNGRRPGFETDGGRRSLPHYPRVFGGSSASERYESRGFVASSFMKGLNPRELFFHAKSGREGMISTSQMTGVTGYAERKMVKLNEDLTAAYDGTVRDAHKNIVQFVYAGHGFDPQRCFRDGEPVSFSRLATLLTPSDSKAVRIPPVNNLMEAQALIPPFPGQPPEPIERALKLRHGSIILRGASAHPVSADLHEKWRTYVTRAYALARVAPGEAVGVLCAQSIGAKQTQQTLDTFHKAGGFLKGPGHRQFGELLSLTQRPKKRSCVLSLKGFDDKDGGYVRDALGVSLTSKALKDLLAAGPIRIQRSSVNEKRTDSSQAFWQSEAPYSYVLMRMDMDLCFTFRITPDDAAHALNARFEPPHFFTEPTVDGVRLCWRGVCAYDQLLRDAVAVKVGDVFGVEGYDLYERVRPREDETRWVAVTKGSNLRVLLAHPRVIPQQSNSDDIWDVYRTLGMAATRRRLRQLMMACVGDDVHVAHVRLLTDRMTCKGRPAPIDRYTMRTCDVGPLSRAAFEESLDILVGAAVTAEREYCAGVSARVIAGLRPATGTGYFTPVIDSIVMKPDL